MCVFGKVEARASTYVHGCALDSRRADSLSVANDDLDPFFSTAPPPPPPPRAHAFSGGSSFADNGYGLGSHEEDDGGLWGKRGLPLRSTAF